jgi:hypothetical protein
MFSRMVGTSDLEKAKSFYDATLDTLGVPAGNVDRYRIFWRTKTGAFSSRKPINGERAAVGGAISRSRTSARRRNG